MADNNKISLYAPRAIKTQTAIENPSSGFYYTDAAWENGTNNKRIDGVQQGVASSIEYNTALRQSAFMARLLAQIQLNRYPKDEQNKDIIVSAETDGTVEDTLQARVNYLASFWTSDNFLLPKEVKSKHIGDGEVKTLNIENGAVIPSKLDKFIRENEGVSSANWLTVTLSKNDAGLGIKLEGDIVNKSATVKTASGKDREFYLLGTTRAISDTTTPVFRDDVYVDMSGTLKASRMEASSYNATSDVRLKQNMCSLDIDATHIVKAIPILTYEYKSEPKEHQIGITAQSLASMCPELVFEGDDKYLRIKESKLVYVLWKALQESIARIELLETELHNLKMQ